MRVSLAGFVLISQTGPHDVALAGLGLACNSAFVLDCWTYIHVNVHFVLIPCLFVSPAYLDVIKISDILVGWVKQQIVFFTCKNSMGRMLWKARPWLLG